MSPNLSRSKVLHDYADRQPAALFLDSEHLDLFGRIPAALPFAIKAKIPAKIVPVELRWKPLALKNCTLDRLFGGPTLLHSIAGVRVDTRISGAGPGAS